MNNDRQSDPAVSETVAKIRDRIAALAQSVGGEVADRLAELDAMRRSLTTTSERSAEFVGCIFDLTGLYHDLGFSTRMVPLLERAIDVSRDLGDTRLLRRALSNYGYLAGTPANAPRALDCLRQSLQLAQEGGTPPQKAAVLQNMGVLLQQCGFLTEAREAYLAAFGIFEQQPESFQSNSVDAVVPLVASNGLASVCSLEGLNEEALAWTERALHIHGDMKAGPGYQTVLLTVESNRCQSLAKLGRLAEASRVAERLISLTHESDSPRYRYLALSAAGLTAVRLGKVEEGLDLVRQARELTRPLQASIQSAADLALADAYTLAGRRAEAAAVLDEMALTLKSIQRAGLGLANVTSEHSFSQILERRTHELRLESAMDLPRKLDPLDSLAASVEAKLDASGEHTVRVGALAKLVADRVPSASALRTDIEQAARLHDIGNTVVPQSVLLKQAPLAVHERTLLSRHTKEGEDLIREQLGHDARSIFVDVARSHHERFDGTGYPEGLASDTIPLAARIVAVVDAYDSMTHGRPWRKAIPHDDVAVFLLAEKGAQFDPTAVDVLLAVVAELRADGGSLDEKLITLAAPSAMITARRAVAQVLRR